jgi:predicted nucleic acid-binding protein
MKAFIDTNVVLYLVSADATKADRATELLRAGLGASVQLLAEMTNVCRRKFGMTWSAIADVRAAIESACQIFPLTHDIHRAAISLATDHDVPIYDAQMVAAAMANGATTFWSEDLQDGRVFGRQLTVRNPFARTSPQAATL